MDKDTKDALEIINFLTDMARKFEDEEYCAKMDKELDDFYIERLGTPTPLFFLYNTADKNAIYKEFRIRPRKTILIDNDKTGIYICYKKWSHLNEDGRIVHPSDEIKQLFPKCDKAMLWDKLDEDGQLLYAINAPNNIHFIGKINGYFVFTHEPVERLDDSVEYGWKVRRKIEGWYQKEDYYPEAISRIVHQREEIVSLLKSVEKVDTKRLIAYLDKSGFFYRPSAANRHHNFPGGLAEHSLGTYKIVREWDYLSPEERRESELYKKHLSKHPVDCDIFTEKMDRDDMILSAICHDLCKAEHYYFKGRRILSHRSDSEPKHAHATLSVKRLKAAGIDTPECEELLLAVLMHMHLYSKPRFAKEAQDQQKARRSMLAIAVWGADKLDASRHPAGRLHRDR